MIGGGIAEDVEFIPQTLPDPARPNNVVAPFWTDLDFSTGGELRVAALAASATESWYIIDFEDVPTY